MNIKSGLIKLLDVRRHLLTIIITSMFSIMQNQPLYSQANQCLRIAHVVIDSAQLDNYRAALKEGIETAVRAEPGVISLYAVYDKNNPTHVTVFEIYADIAAYESHVQTAHFKKYKSTVQNMVKSLELTDVVPIAFESKSK
jgi:quinol monooxygenase YgiN